MDNFSDSNSCTDSDSNSDYDEDKILNMYLEQPRIKKMLKEMDISPWEAKIKLHLMGYIF